MEMEQRQELQLQLEPIRTQHHELDLFALKPINDRARSVVADPQNRHLVSAFVDSKSTVINVGHVRSDNGFSTLATMGRRGDIVISGSTISRIHCSFELMHKHDTDEMMVMFVDRSPAQSCEVSGEYAFPLRYNRDPRVPRQVMIRKDINTVIGLGGTNRNLVMFEIIWYGTNVKIQENIKKRAIGPLSENPANQRTYTEDETGAPSRIMTRTHTPGLNTRDGIERLPIRVLRSEASLGKGSFGEVFRGYNVDTGQAVAVKVIQTPGPSNSMIPSVQSYWKALKREMKLMGSCQHVSQP